MAEKLQKNREHIATLKRYRSRYNMLPQTIQ